MNLNSIQLHLSSTTTLPSACPKYTRAAIPTNSPVSTIPVCKW